MITVVEDWAVRSTLGARLALPGEEVHVWRAPLILQPAVLRRLELTLAPDERSRAARFVAERDQRRFVAARGILRELLAAYVNRPADTLEFDYGAYGKPALRADNRGLPIRFNLSHSHDLALYCVARGREVGVDMERVRPDFGGEDVAERSFSLHEVAELRALPPELRAQGFFNCWTRKEAYVKARGHGLQFPLDSFSVSLVPGQPDQLSVPDRSRWTLRSFQLSPQFVAAVVAEGSDWKLRYSEWTP